MVVWIADEVIVILNDPRILFTASAEQLPGIFGGKIDLNALPDEDYIVNVKLETKYSADGPFLEAESKDVTKKDKILRLTPVEENYGYQITIMGIDGTPIIGSLPYVITRSPIV